MVLAKCLADGECVENLICLQLCNGRPDETACQVILLAETLLYAETLNPNGMPQCGSKWSAVCHRTFLNRWRSSDTGTHKGRLHDHALAFRSMALACTEHTCAQHQGAQQAPCVGLL